MRLQSRFREPQKLSEKIVLQPLIFTLLLL